MSPIVVYSIPGITAFFAALWLFIAPRQNRVKTLLGITLILFGLAQIACAQFFNPDWVARQYFAPVYFILITLVPPCYCLFISSLTYPKMKFAHGWVFFSASLLYIAIYLVLLVIMTPADFEFYSRCIIGGEPFTEYPSKAARLMNIIGCGVFRLMMATLMCLTIYASIVRINKFQALLESYISRASEKIQSPRALVYHFSCGFIPCWLLLTAWPPCKANVKLMSIVLIIMAIIIAFAGFYGAKIEFTAMDLKSLSSSESDAEEEKAQDAPASSYSVIPQEIAKLNDATAKLLKAINEDKVYLDPNLTIVSLAESMGVNRVYLSKMLNFLFDMSFNSYIRQLRIECAKKELSTFKPEDAANSDHEQMCNRFGYCFCAVFIKDFQEATGMTPMQWIEHCSQQNAQSPGTIS